MPLLSDLPETLESSRRLGPGAVERIVKSGTRSCLARLHSRINNQSYSQAMYPSVPPDAYHKFSAGAPPTAPPPAAYQQHGAVNIMNPSRPGAGLRTWSTGLFHCMDDPGNCK